MLAENAALEPVARGEAASDDRAQHEEDAFVELTLDEEFERLVGGE